MSDTNRPTAEQAMKSAQRFIDQHFNNADTERPVTRIPADPERDDDLVLTDYIEQSGAENSALRARLREAEALITDAVGSVYSEIVPAQSQGAAICCGATGNPCGTDTRPVGKPCTCGACKWWSRARDFLATLLKTGDSE